MAALVRELAQERNWQGKAEDLLALLCEMLKGRHGDKADEITRRRSWPKSPRVLSVHLDRLDPQLRACGIQVIHGSRRSLTITTDRAPF